MLTSISLLAALPAGLGPEFQINTHTPAGQLRPVVAADATGRFLVVWEGYGQSTTRPGIFGQRFDSAGARLGAEFLIKSDATAYQGHPALAMDGAGNFVVVWENYVPGSSQSDIFGRRFDSAGIPIGGEFQVNTYTTSYQESPRIEMDGAGNFIVVWSSYLQDGSGGGIFAQRFAGTGAPAGAEFRVNESAYDFEEAPDVAMSSSGAFVVVWEQTGYSPSYNGIYGQAFDSAGAPQGSPFRVDEEIGDSLTYPAIAMNGPGWFVVAWESYVTGSGDSDIHVRLFDGAGGASGTFQVNTYTTSYQEAPRVSMDDAGSFVVVWESAGQDGSASGIFAHAFDVTSGPSGEFQVNTYTPSYQQTPDLTLASGGDLIVAWQSEGQDGSATGVFGQRYCLSGPGGITDLGVVRSGNDLHFAWTDASLADDYTLYGDAAPSGSFSTVEGGGTSGSTGISIPLPSGNVFYLLAARKAGCEGPKRG